MILILVAPIAVLLIFIWITFEMLKNDYRKYRKKNFEDYEESEKPFITHK